MASDYVQDSVENQPDKKHCCDSPGDHLKGTDAIDTVGVAPYHVVVHSENTGVVTPRFFAAGICRFRFPAAGLVFGNFFTAPFHAIKWEGTL